MKTLKEKPLKSEKAEYDKYVLDTCRVMSNGKYLPGAITYRGRKKIQSLSWKGHLFDTQREADTFVCKHFTQLGIQQPTDLATLFRDAPPSWGVPRA